VKALVPQVGHTVEVALRPEIAKQFQEAQRDLQMMLRLFSTYVVDLLPKHQEMVAPNNVWDQSFSPIGGLIGRDQDVENILKVLDASETEVVAVVGMAGVGKTAFISEVCRKYAAKGEGIVYHLWVHVSQNFDTEMIFRGLMTSLSEWEPGKDPESYWWCMKEGLVNQKYLVVYYQDSCSCSRNRRVCNNTEQEDTGKPNYCYYQDSCSCSRNTDCNTTQLTALVNRRFTKVAE
jgi:hypothetical protein